ncbi:MAG: hypothetical protein ACLFOY_14375 [Desulfatibacillaceae bacterium]
MGKIFRPSNRESRILSRIESDKEYKKRQAIGQIPDVADSLSNAVAIKLVEEGLVETNNKNAVQEQIQMCLEGLSRADDFDIDYATAPFRKLVSNPHPVTLYLTAFVVEKLINHKAVVDIFGSDLDIYSTIHKQVARFLS